MALLARNTMWRVAHNERSASNGSRSLLSFRCCECCAHAHNYCELQRLKSGSQSGRHLPTARFNCSGLNEEKLRYKKWKVENNVYFFDIFIKIHRKN